MAGLASPYADPTAYQDIYGNMNSSAPGTTPYIDPVTGMYSVRFTDAAGNIQPVGVLSGTAKAQDPAPTTPTTPTPTTPTTTTTGTPPYQWRPTYDRGGQFGGQQGHTGNDRMDGGTQGPPMQGGYIDGTQQPGRFSGPLGISGGTAVDTGFQLHDTVNIDAVDAIGGLIGGFIGVPGMGTLASKAAGYMDASQNFALADVGLQGISVAEVLANPDNFSSRQVKAAEAAKAADEAGTNRQASGDIGDPTADPSARMYGVRNAAGNYTDTGYTETDKTRLGALPLPGHKPAVPSGLAAPGNDLNRSLQDNPGGLGAAQSAARGLSSADREAVGRSLDQAARDNPGIF